MPRGAKGTVVFWANRPVGVPSCPAPPRRSAVRRPAPTRLWYVRVLDSTSDVQHQTNVSNCRTQTGHTKSRSGLRQRTLVARGWTGRDGHGSVRHRDNRPLSPQASLTTSLNVLLEARAREVSFVQTTVEYKKESFTSSCPAVYSQLFLGPRALFVPNCWQVYRCLLIF